MTNKAFWMVAGALAVAQAAAVAAQGAPAAPPSAAPSGSAISKEQADKILGQCGARQFETSAQFTVDGKVRRTGLKMCSTPGETDEAWITRLEKAAAAVEAQASLPDSAKAQVAADVRSEVRRLKALQRRTLPAADALVATVPAMPPPLPPRPVIPVGTYVAPSLIAAPVVSIRCLNQGGERDRGVDCEGQIRRDTVLALESGENMTAPATVRFLRKGQLREEVQLGTLRQGQLVRLRLPRSVCKGVVRSELALEVVSTGKPGKPAAALTEGPYDLRC